MVEARVKKIEILKAASECFARYGYDKTTLDDIGKIVGLNKASLYYYYKNKEAIFSDVIFEETEALFQALTQKVKGIRGCKEQILEYVTERLKYLLEAVNLRALSMENLISFKPVFEKLSQSFVAREIDFLGRILDECRIKGDIRECNTLRVAESILLMADAVQQKHSQCGCSMSPNVDFVKVEEDVRFMVSLILNGLVHN